MKKQTTKRALAGVLAVLTVAGSAPANVGGLILAANNAIVASAADQHDVSLTWTDADDSGEALKKYITSIEINGESVPAVNKTTGYTFEKVNDKASTMKIVSKVPLDLTNFAGYADKTQTVKNDSSYKLVAGDYTISESGKFPNVVYTYEFNLLETAANKSFDLVGQKQTVTYAYRNLGAQTTAATVTTTKPNTAENGTIDAAEPAKFFIQGDATLKNTTNFSVMVYDSSKEGSTLDPDVTYDTDEGKYVATFKMPTKYEGADKQEKLGDVNYGDSVIIVLQPQKAEALDYTISKGQLLASGTTVVDGTVAAEIKATQQRAEVRDPETDAVVDEEIKANTELAYEGSMKYGYKADDGVSLTVTRDAKLTKADGRDGTTKGKYGVVTIYKDGAIYKTTASGGDAAAEFAALNPNIAATATYPASASEWNELMIDSSFTSINLPKFKNAGDYEIEVTFFTENASQGTDTKKVNFKFKITPQDVDASDATVSFSYDNVAENTNANKVTPKPVSFKKDGVLEIQVPDELKGTTFTAHIEVPAIYEAAYEAFRAAGGNTTAYSKDVIEDLPPVGDFPGWEKDEAYKAQKTLTATEFDVVNTAEILVYDQNFGAPYSANHTKFKTITLKYKLVKEIEEPEITPLIGSDFEADQILKVAVADTDIDSFTDIFWDNFKGNDTVEENKDKISFEYLEGTDRAATVDDLDSRNAGVPTKKSEINYTLYVLYDGEAFTSIPLQVVSVKAKVTPAESDLTFDFGNKLAIDSKKCVIKDSKGNVQKNLKHDGIIAKTIYMAKDTDLNTDGVQPGKDTDGKYKRANNLNLAGKDFLDAGTYIVTFGAKVPVDADYTISSDEFIVVVEKREITGDMFLMNKAYSYTTAATGQNVQYNATTGWPAALQDFNFMLKDPDDDTKYVGLYNGSAANTYYTGNTSDFKVSGGDTKAYAAGEYTIKITANKNSKNFTGTASVNWYVASETNNTQVVEFEWDPDETLLFDNARVHVQFKKTADSKVTAINPNTKKKYVISDYGVIIDKDNKIAAPTKDELNDVVTGSGNKNVYEYQKANAGTVVNTAHNLTANDGFNKKRTDAEAALLLGNGFTAGHVSEENKKDNIYGANIKFNDVKKGVWVRPYALLDDGTVVYGKAIFLDITREAEKQLQFQLNPVKKLDKTNNIAGYDMNSGKYVFYASYSKLDSTKIKAEVKDFGVLVDKSNKFTKLTPEMDPYASTDLYGKFVLASDKKTKIDDAFQYGKGFIEGHFNPDNEKLGANEYGAKIKPQDSVSGVWVRGYIKLSDDLIVYSEPAYYNSVSEYYAKAANNVNLREEDYDVVRDAEGKYIRTTRQDETGVDYFAKFQNNTAIANQACSFNAVAPYFQNGDVAYQNAAGKYSINFANLVKANHSKLDFVAQGVVVDKNETLVTKEYDSDNSRYVYNWKDGYASKLQLGKGFVEGKKTKASADYSASVTPNAGKAIVIRPYVIVKVTGTETEVTIYGAPICVTEKGVQLPVQN